MATLITDPEIEQRIRAQRAEWGADRFDEVWEGMYLMTPLPNSEHAEIQTTLAAVFRFALGFDSPVKVYTGVNVSDRAEGWTENYRCPDVVVVLPGSTARDCGAFHLGGPDFVVEIVSPYDHSREKIEFYEDVSVRELLLVDRDPWVLELYRLNSGRLDLVGQSRLEQPDILQSVVLPLSFQLVRGETRPRIEVCHSDGIQKWVV